ncbi:MAG: hypothetical protein JWO36_4793 [Myxococcales bacterium]|nr:hypothetical protein [Myxococcales bacterium]
MLALAACGPSAAELRTAKTATYTADSMKLLKLASEAAQNEHYKIGEVDAADDSFMTVPIFYGPEGDLQSAGSEGVVHISDRSVRVSFIVKVIEIDSRQAMIAVTPKTFQVITGSPKPRELAPDDPNLPPFVRGRADALAMAIYNYARPYLAK